MAVVPVTTSSRDSGIVQMPLFRVTDAGGQERFVDTEGRDYHDFEDSETPTPRHGVRHRCKRCGKFFRI